MLRIEMLPANQGDCLWIEYGDPKKPRQILIDGGTSGSIKPLVAKVKALPASRRRTSSSWSSRTSTPTTSPAS